MVKYNKLLDKEEYKFIFNNKLLKDRILFLCYGGSISYGTNVDGSDIDIRGVFLEPLEITLGLEDCEQYVDNKTDTVIYSFKKFIKLVRECNPNIIEMLFCKEEDYLYVSEKGKILLDNRDMFLTRKAEITFSGYAKGQLSRLENALARDELKEEISLEHIKNSVLNSAMSYETKYKLPANSIKTSVGSWNGSDKLEILVDVNLKEYPLSRLKGMVLEMSNVVTSYTNKSVGERNNKKDDNHLNKHMMHLIRLYFMCIEILKDETLHTYREKEHDLLMDIRNGYYRDKKGYLKEEFYLLLNKLKEELEFWKNKTKLKKEINRSELNKLVMSIYKD